jgi:hypothetical protein
MEKMGQLFSQVHVPSGINPEKGSICPLRGKLIKLRIMLMNRYLFFMEPVLDKEAIFLKRNQ